MGVTDNQEKREDALVLSYMQVVDGNTDIEHTSLPERIRNLPNGHLNLSHENFTVKAILDFFGRCCFEK